MGKDNVQNTWKDYFADLYSKDTEEQVAINV